MVAVCMFSRGESVTRRLPRASSSGGAKPESETNYLITTLFRGQEGLEFFNRTVESRVARLPGFAGFSALTERLAPIVQA